MKAELDTISGQPVLRLEKILNFSSRRAVFDLPLTPEQVKAIAIHTEIG